MQESVLFGRYRLIERAGAGGNALVWRGIDEETGEDVAVKRLHAVVLAEPGARQRLERESRILGALAHPNIVALRDVRIEDDEAAIVLDYVDGQSVAERLADGPLPTGDAVRVVRDVAAALTAAHAAGIVHRDVKPANIVLASDGRAMLTDFGISAEPGDASAAAITATGTLVGTFRYMAPEQLRGVPASPASDQYALAAVAYEMLCGRPPYAATTPVALAEAQAEPPIAIDGVRPQLDAAVRRGLARDPADRYPDVTAFGAAVATSVQAARSTDDTDVVPVVAASSAPAAPPAPPMPVAASPFRGPHRGGAAVAAIGAAVVGAVVLGSLGGGGSEPSPDAQTDLATPLAAPTATPTTSPARDEGGEDRGKPDKDDKPDKPEKPDRPDNRDSGRGGGNGNPGGGND